jgi:hypothetical protein
MYARKARIARLFSGTMIFAALVLGYLAVRGMNKAVVLVEWSTASELDTAGFNLYRAEKPEGPFTRINTELIPASLDPLTGGSYQYEDRQARPGVVYYYQLEGVEYNGSSSRFGPIEVKAANAGNVEVVLAAAFVLASGIGYVLLTK